MTIVKPNKVEWVSFFVLMPVIAAANCFVLFGSSWFLRFGYWLYGFGTMMLIGLLFWYIDVVLTRFIHDRFAAFKAEYLRNGADPSNLRYGYVLKG